MRCLNLLLVVSIWMLVQPARAEPANRYGAKGRTVLSTGFNGLVHGSGYTQSQRGWQVAARATLVHFVRDNFAIGGTVVADVDRLRDTGYEDAEHVRAYTGGDLDMVGHVPMTRHLSLRFWGWVGMRQNRRKLRSYGLYSGEASLDTQKVRYAVFGFTPELLIHCSSSVALALGPSLTVTSRAPEGEWNVTVSVGPSLSYSFGPPPRDERSEPTLTPRFAARGRNVLTGGLSLGESPAGAIGYARFVTDHFALGPHVFGGASEQIEDLGMPYWVGAGLQMLAELPLRGRWSVLFLSGLDYRHDRFFSYVPPLPDYYVIERDSIKTHELALSGSVLPTFHLFEALVLGLGPTITEHVRVATNTDGLDRAYLSLGVTSLLAGSF